MKGRRLFLVSGLAALAVLAAGCCVMLQFRIRNATGQDIRVTGGHTHKTVTIPNGAAKIMPHAAGNVTVTRTNGKAWLYKNLTPLQFNKTRYAVHGRFLCNASITVDVLIDPTGRVFVLPPNATSIDGKHAEQPAGFPCVPSE